MLREEQVLLGRGSTNWNNTDHESRAHFSSSDPLLYCRHHQACVCFTPEFIRGPLTDFQQQLPFPGSQTRVVNSRDMTQQPSLLVLGLLEMLSLGQEPQPHLKSQLSSSYVILVFILFDHGALLLDGCLTCPLCHVRLHGATIHPCCFDAVPILMVEYTKLHN